MQTKTLTYSVRKSTGPNPEGVFEAHVAETWPEDAPKERADHDGDIFATGAFDVQDGAIVPVLYQHAYGDPGADIGRAVLRPTPSVLAARGQLRIGTPMADAVFERMLLPSADPLALQQFSVGFEYDPAESFKRSDGVRVIRKARVLEVSVVFAGAQRTELLSIKASRGRGVPRVTPGSRVPSGVSLAAQKEALLREFGDSEEIREALDLPTCASIAAVERKARAAEVRAALDARCVLLTRTRLVIDPRFRPVIDPERERDAERRARDLQEIERRNVEREREAAERDRAAALLPDDGVFRWQM